MRRIAALAAIAAAASAGVLLAGWPLLAGAPVATRAPAAASADPASRDLPAIRAEGVLRVVAVRDDVSWLERRGAPEGFVADLAAWLAERLDLRLELVEPVNPAQGLRLVQDGRADLLAVADPGPDDAGARVTWTDPLERARPVVVGRDARSIEAVEDLRGRTIAVRRHSRLEAVARAWRGRLGGDLQVVRVRPDATDRRLAADAARRVHDLVLIDEHRGRLEAGAFGPLATSRPLGEPLPVRWALRDNAPQLARAVRRLLDGARRDGLVAEIGRRYLEDPFRLKALRRPVFRPSGPRLSPWDGVFRSAADEHGFDWHLIAALSFAESGYDRWEVSPVGAMGLLQLMPRIARAYGADDPYDPEQNVAAGARLLRWLHDVYDDLDGDERDAFALAAYNIGIGHVEDARDLAKQRGLDPDRWIGHVETVLPLLEDPEIAADLPHGRARGSVTVTYVRHVLALWRGFAGATVAAASTDAADARG